MSILDDEEDKLSHIDDAVDEIMVKKLMFTVYEISKNEIDNNNTADQIGRDVFNREIYVGDWVLIFRNMYGYNFEVAKVKYISEKKIKVKYIKVVDLYNNKPIFGIKSVNPTSILKITDKHNFYKEIVGDKYINNNKN